MANWEAWQSPDGLEITLAKAEEIPDMREKRLLGASAQLLYRFEAATYEEAQAIHHLRMGWEPYNPLGDASPCPKCGAMYYAEGSRE
ncbi:MAG TPA: hypothetical protein VKE49_00310, partial [Myxococcaceae bacterium]|nr:hypothetical protein [Myxococcaceae bacterium]